MTLKVFLHWDLIASTIQKMSVHPSTRLVNPLSYQCIGGEIFYIIMPLWVAWKPIERE